MKQLFTLFTLLIGLCWTTNSFAINSTPPALDAEQMEQLATISPNTEMTKAERKALKKELRSAKRADLLERLEAQQDEAMEGLDLDDPVKKWMWFWLLAWAGAAVIWILATILNVGRVTAGVGRGAGISALYYLSYLLSLLGSVCAVIWLIKMLEL